jgi:hypothetical protein
MAFAPLERFRQKWMPLLRLGNAKTQDLDSFIVSLERCKILEHTRARDSIAVFCPKAIELGRRIAMKVNTAFQWTISATPDAAPL